MENFGSKRGLIITAIGSAVGLGNLFRFPGLAARYGIWFVLVYFLLLFAFGFPLLSAELYFGGRPTEKSFVGAKLSGFFCLANCLLIALCYTVFFGLVIKQTAFSKTENSADFLFVFGAAGVAILFRGSTEKLQKISEIGVIFSVLTLGVTAIFALAKNPDGFTEIFKVSADVLLKTELYKDVLGQVFFSLSLGVGVMTAFGALLPKNASVFGTSLAVCLFDFSVSLISTIIYLCLGGARGTTTQSLTLFATLFRGFFGKKLGIAVGFFFFSGVALLCLQSVLSYLAALTVNAKNPHKRGMIILTFSALFGVALSACDYKALNLLDGAFLPVFGLLAGGVQAVSFALRTPKKGRSFLTVYFGILVPLIFLFLLL